MSRSPQGLQRLAVAVGRLQAGSRGVAGEQQHVLGVSQHFAVRPELVFARTAADAGQAGGELERQLDVVPRVRRIPVDFGHGRAQDELAGPGIEGVLVTFGRARSEVREGAAARQVHAAHRVEPRTEDLGDDDELVLSVGVFGGVDVNAGELEGGAIRGLEAFGGSTTPNGVRNEPLASMAGAARFGSTRRRGFGGFRSACLPRSFFLLASGAERIRFARRFAAARPPGSLLRALRTRRSVAVSPSPSA